MVEQCFDAQVSNQFTEAGGNGNFKIALESRGRLEKSRAIMRAKYMREGPFPPATNVCHAGVNRHASIYGRTHLADATA